MLGFGGHARSVVDSIERQGCYRIAGFTDREEMQKNMYRGYRVIGKDDDLPSIYLSGIHNAFITLGFLGKSNMRKNLYFRLKELGFQIPSIIDPAACIASDIRIGEGNFIGKNAVINSQAVIGNACIINTASVVEHDCIVGDFSHVAVGAVLCGGVRLGQEVFVGANATVIQECYVGNRAVVGAGITVRENLPNDVVYVGQHIRSKV